MEFTTLGRTGLKVSVASLGCGGGSSLGQKLGKSEAHSVSIVKKAMDLGVNFIDTANAYGTETIVGKAIKDMPRDQVVISTKHHAIWSGKKYSPDEVIAGLENSLRELGTDYVDIFQLHGGRTKKHRIWLVARATPIGGERKGKNSLFGHH